MTYGVDTSVLLRVLTGQPVALAQKVRARLKDLWRSGAQCSVCDVVVSEAYYALQHSYGISKEKAIQALKNLSENPGFSSPKRLVRHWRHLILQRQAPVSLIASSTEHMCPMLMVGM